MWELIKFIFTGWRITPEMLSRRVALKNHNGVKDWPYTVKLTPSDTERLDWLDKHCAFVADYEYSIGPFKVGELRKMADAGILVDKTQVRP